MRGPLTLGALLVPLWSSPLVGALAVDNPFNIKVPRGAPASPRTADVLLSLDVPAVDGSDRTESHYLHLKFGEVDTPCGTPDITVNGRAISPTITSVAPLTGDLVFRDLDLNVDSEKAPSDISTIEAVWAVECVRDPSDPDSTDWDIVGSELQRFLFHIRDVGGRDLDEGGRIGPNIAVEFRQTDPEILDIMGPATVVAQGDFSALSAAEEMSMLADLVELEELHRQLADLQATVARKQAYMASAYGLRTSTTGEQGECQLGRLRCAVQRIADQIKKVIVQIFGEEAVRNCDLFSWDKSDRNQTEDPDTSIDTILRPKPTHEHPLVGESEPSPGSSSSLAGEEKPLSFLDDHGDDVLFYLVPIIAVISLICMLHCCCVRWNARRASRDSWCAHNRREELRRRWAERRSRVTERWAIVKASVRRVFDRIFCRASLEDEEKEAERQRVLEDGHGPSPPPRWVPINRHSTQFDRVATPPVDFFTIGSDVDDEEADDHRRVLGRPRSIRDSESITLVGTEGSESGRDSDDEDVDSNDEKGHSLLESDDGASENESESGVSDMSTTMEMDLARFREATMVVSNMVAAGEGRMRMLEREQVRERVAQARSEWRRPLSPASSLPGYASDDGRPPTYEDANHPGGAGELADSVIANGFRYVPGSVSELAGAGRDDHEKN
ncbi:hypothetical protein ACRALDRAFT_1059822 [Sodiomyces alcalophilus JCM 7366]|uniref:uncharacterized protein n=1 Tax=Sodiomyces alcalophilus JCM 7366 TaxID=591952 RepID=UPI0039B630EC